MQVRIAASPFLFVSQPPNHRVRQAAFSRLQPCIGESLQVHRSISTQQKHFFLHEMDYYLKMKEEEIGQEGLCFYRLVHAALFAAEGCFMRKEPYESIPLSIVK